MYNINFLPNWYKEKKLERLKQIIGIINICIVLFDIVLFIIVSQEIKNIRDKSHKIEEIRRINGAQIANSNILPDNKASALSTYMDLLKYMTGEVKINVLDITEKEAIVEASVKSKENYMNLIKAIEKEQIFSIEHISITGHKENIINFRIILSRI